MKGRMIVIYPDGSMSATAYDTAVTLKDLRGAVGGPIESVPGWDRMGGKPCWTICNEEGKIEGLPFNAFAQHLWGRVASEYANMDTLVGPIAILAGDQEFMDAL